MQCPDCGLEMVENAEVCDCGYTQLVIPQAEEPAPVFASDAIRKPSKSGKLKKPVYRFKFHGTAGGLFGLFIKNLLLTLVTCGIYYFWAKTNVRKYMYSQTEFHGDRFAYHGTGKELLIGRLKAIGMFFVVYLVPMTLMMVGKNSPLALVGVLLLYAGILAVIPIAVVGSLRYRLSRTSLHGIRFSFRGSAMDFVKMSVPNGLLTLVSFGFYAPIALTKALNYVVPNIYYGNTPLQFHGETSGFYWKYIRGMFLSPLTFGIMSFWMRADIDHFIWDNVTFGKARFRSKVTGGQLFGLAFVNMAIIGLSCGLAFPVALVRSARFSAENLALFGAVDMAAIKQEAQQASAFGDGLADALDMNLEIGL